MLHGHVGTQTPTGWSGVYNLWGWSVSAPNTLAPRTNEIRLILLLFRPFSAPASSKLAKSASLRFDPAASDSCPKSESNCWPESLEGYCHFGASSTSYLHDAGHEGIYRELAHALYKRANVCGRLRRNAR